MDGRPGLGRPDPGRRQDQAEKGEGDSAAKRSDTHAVLLPVEALGVAAGMAGTAPPQERRVPPSCPEFRAADDLACSREGKYDMSGHEAEEKSELGHAVTVLRTALDLSQEEVAEGGPISAGALSNIEQGKTDPKRQTVEAIVACLRVPRSTLARAVAFNRSVAADRRPTRSWTGRWRPGRRGLPPGASC
jgi:DNA-binding XRE family transcriptional regulator